MAGSLNKVIFIGNVGKDPEVRSTSDGKEIASFSIATSESWKDKATGERRERTEWHKITVFNDSLVNLVKNYVKRGSKLYIEGSVQTRKWLDNTGQERYTTEIVLQNYASNITLLDSRTVSNNETETDQLSSNSETNSEKSQQEPSYDEPN